jgi:hypothetical protein
MENHFGKLGNDQIQALQKAQPIVNGILKAQDDGDYDAFCAYFEGPLKQNITRDDFHKNQQNIANSMGHVIKTHFVTSLKRTGLVGLVYKCKFSKSDDDFMVTITFNDTVNPPMATGIWIS